MISQIVWSKVTKQLLSVCELLQSRSALNSASGGVATCNPNNSFPYIVRSLSSVPQPPMRIRPPGQRRECDDAQEDAVHSTSDGKGGVTFSGSSTPKNNNAPHIPVMIVVDMTFGAGGHARNILSHHPHIQYIAVDRDPVAFKLAKSFAAEFREGQVLPLLSKFSEVPKSLKQYGLDPGTVDCVLMDLGVSSMQFDTADRGFAISKDGPLDMRMGGLSCGSPTAADVVNTLEPHDLARILRTYGEEKKSKAIAHAIVEARYAFGPFTRTKQLADIVKSVFESSFRHDKLHRHSHVATKTFQALRIFVNDELNEINNGLEVARHYLKPQGRCAVISFHSLEDRIVKRQFCGQDMDLRPNQTIHSHFRNSNVSYDNEEIRETFLSSHWLPLQRKVTEPTEAEVLLNPRARSAKLRAAIKLEQTERKEA